MTKNRRKMRIRVYEHDSSLRDLLSIVCRMVSDDVQISSEPLFCGEAASGAHSAHECPGHCGSVLVVDAHLLPLSGFEWLQAQCQSDCQLLPEDVLLLATSWTDQDRDAATSLGCAVMTKPFHISDLTTWLKSRLSLQSDHV